MSIDQKIDEAVEAVEVATVETVGIQETEIETPSGKTGITLPTRQLLTRATAEVLAEFCTSSEEVYKEGLRSLIRQENLLLKQVDTIRKDLLELSFVKNALEADFMAGILISEDDARDCTKKARREFKQDNR